MMKHKRKSLFLDSEKDVLLGNYSTKGWLLDSIILIPFMGVQFFVNIGYAWYSALARLFITFIVFLLFIIKKEKPEIKIVIGYIIISLLYLFATFLNNGDIFDSVSRYYGMIMMICLASVRRDRVIRLCYSFLFTSELFIYANLFALIFYPYPDGLFFSEEGNPHWIIGQKQDFVIVFLPCLVSSLILWFNGIARKRIIFIFLAMVVTLSLVLTLGLTLIIFMLIFLVFYSYITNRSFRGKTLFRFYMLMEVLCVLVAISRERTQIVFSYLDYLRSSNDAKVSKGDTMLDRLNMWYDALHNISNNFWGLGSLSEQRFYRLMPNSGFHPHVHNMLIDMAHTGGVLCSLLYLYIVYRTFVSLDKISSTHRNILVYSLFVSNILTLTECFYWPLSVLPLILAHIYVNSYWKYTYSKYYAS